MPVELAAAGILPERRLILAPVAFLGFVKIPADNFLPFFCVLETAADLPQCIVHVFAFVSARCRAVGVRQLGQDVDQNDDAEYLKDDQNKQGGAEDLGFKQDVKWHKNFPFKIP
jgi:hypothetical protein